MAMTCVASAVGPLHPPCVLVTTVVHSTTP